MSGHDDRLKITKNNCPMSMRSIGPWSSRFPLSFSWHIWTAASAKPMSVRKLKRSLGFSQEEWLEDPIRWYQQIHPEDKERWSVEAAQMFLSGTPLRSAYRVMARDGALSGSIAKPK